MSEVYSSSMAFFHFPESALNIASLYDSGSDCAILPVSINVCSGVSRRPVL